MPQIVNLQMSAALNTIFHLILFGTMVTITFVIRTSSRNINLVQTNNSYTSCNYMGALLLILYYFNYL